MRSGSIPTRYVKAGIDGHDLLVSQIGFGCGRLFGGIERRHASRLLECAYELGIRHFDTAPSYGHGQSEDVIGDVFAGVADVTIMTKVGIPRPPGAPSLLSAARRLTLRRALSRTPSLKGWLLTRWSTVVRNETPRPTRVLERDIVLRSFEDSLKRLRRDRIDFYCVHEPDQYFIDDALLSVFNSLKASGQIFAHGLAWGRAAPLAPAQWNVIQAKYDPGYIRDGRLRFFHGVMRSSHSDAPAQLAKAMGKDRDAVFIFSAGERHQLSSVVRQVITEH